MKHASAYEPDTRERACHHDRWMTAGAQHRARRRSRLGADRSYRGLGLRRPRRGAYLKCRGRPVRRVRVVKIEQTPSGSDGQDGQVLIRRRVDLDGLRSPPAPDRPQPGPASSRLSGAAAYGWQWARILGRRNCVCMRIRGDREVEECRLRGSQTCYFRLFQLSSDRRCLSRPAVFPASICRSSAVPPSGRWPASAGTQ
jgi:hypothetical protein